MRLLPYGDTALLLECGSLAQAQQWFTALHGQAEEVVLGAESVLLRGQIDALRTLVANTVPTPDIPHTAATPIDIPVRYDGPDLDEVAALTGLDAAAVVSLHAGTVWTVAFGGFAPGFSYLVGGDPRLQVPRRDSPRTRIPAGSIGLADRFSGIYPRDSPGGWRLIGHTDLRLWDIEADPPALLTPGRSVRFVVSP